MDKSLVDVDGSTKSQIWNVVVNSSIEDFSKLKKIDHNRIIETAENEGNETKILIRFILGKTDMTLVKTVKTDSFIVILP